MLRRRTFMQWVTALGVFAGLAPFGSCASGESERQAALVEEEEQGTDVESETVVEEPAANEVPVVDEEPVVDEPAVDEEPVVDEPQTVTVYRFQTRKARVCKACRLHRRYKVFLSQFAADQNRAHPGCNCRIVAQVVSQEYAESVMPFEQNGVIDLRAVSA